MAAGLVVVVGERWMGGDVVREKVAFLDASVRESRCPESVQASARVAEPGDQGCRAGESAGTNALYLMRNAISATRRFALAQVVRRCGPMALWSIADYMSHQHSAMSLRICFFRRFTGPGWQLCRLSQFQEAQCVVGQHGEKGACTRRANKVTPSGASAGTRTQNLPR